MSGMIYIEQQKLFAVVEGAVKASIPALLEQLIPIKSKMDEAPDFLTIPNAAKLAGVSSSMIRKLIDEGQVEYKYFANRTKKMIPKGQILKLFKNQIDISCLNQ
jgi:hypothetical protein